MARKAPEILWEIGNVEVSCGFTIGRWGDRVRRIFMRLGFVFSFALPALTLLWLIMQNLKYGFTPYFFGLNNSVASFFRHNFLWNWHFFSFLIYLSLKLALLSLYMSFACRLCSFLRINWNLLFEKPQKRGSVSIVLSQRVKQGRKAKISCSWCVQLSGGLFWEGSPLNPSCLVSLHYLAFFKPSIPRSSSVAIFFLQYRSPPPQ